MRIDIITIFPQVFHEYFSIGVIGKAIRNGILDVRVHDLRMFTDDKHKTVDDKPYGGGGGMILKPEPIFKAVETISKKDNRPYVIFLSPQGKLLNQQLLKELSKRNWLLLICGRYEGIDERVMSLVDDEISIGDYVLSGGELPAMVLVDGIGRLIKGVVKEERSVKEDSFYWKFLDYPQYTHPRCFRDMKVPDVLLSGDHKKIEIWRTKEAIRNTYRKRPDILDSIQMNSLEKKLLKEVIEEENGLTSISKELRKGKGC